ncbi:MAG TPA: type II and III secretion system protein, partial [Rhodocyclaceae bacterium]|nr:type II and III secretion system protein [Rhodocyclaceae bacterium]
ISRIIGQATDPNPALKQQNIQNQIPIVRSREIESMLRVSSGNTAVMGGLMEDLLDNTDDTVPGLSNTPFIGGVFQNRNDLKRKTELVIFIRPTVVHDASINGDYRSYSGDLPTAGFFENNNVGPQLIPKLPEAK